MKLFVPASVDELSLRIERPFFVFEWENLVPVETYRRLLAELPGKDGKDYKAQYAGKLHLNDRQDAFRHNLAVSQVWMEFYKAWKTQAVIDQIQKLVREHIKHRTGVEQRRWVLVKSTNRYPSTVREQILKMLYEKVLRRKTVRLGFEFSVLPDGAAVPPHTDSVRKLVSMLYYFPDDDWSREFGGGTCFYKTKRGFEPWKTWKSYYLKDDQVEQFRQTHELFFETQFLPNRISGFVKTDQSWHEVKPLNLPEGRRRRSLCINIFTW